MKYQLSSVFKRIITLTKFFAKMILVSIVSFILLNFIFPLKVNIQYSQIVTASDGSIIHAFLSKDEKWRMFTEDKDISPQLEKAIIFKEDHWFYYHFGVNPFAIVRAAFNNFTHQQRTSGASTITMQLSRMLYPKDRTYLNKLIDMFHAIQLEMRYSKKEILSMYLTLIPYGGNIEGIKAAALLYYGRSPAKLSIAQITALAVIPNRPNALTPGKKNGQLKTSRDKWLMKMKSRNIFPSKDIDAALSEPIDAFRQKLISEAPHLAIRLHHQNPDVPVINTSLNRSNQQKVSTIAYNYVQRMKALGINNASVLVINNQTKKVVAYVGSADPGDVLNSGQVDGIVAVRSPGSTLKPIVYALAFDKGFITPKTVISDVPVNFDGYSPENYNTKFNGNVTIEKALSNSLNIPAVKILNQLGVSTFTDVLKQASFRQIAKDETKLGLSAILGGCGASLEELTLLYASFSHYGEYVPINFSNTDSINQKTQLISPSSAYMISDILSTLTRPDLPNNYQSSMHIPKIAWKTGTSYGRRDAWSIGYNPNYTVGVWLGNFSGEGVPELSGAEIATPLLFEIFNSIDYNSSNKWFQQPQEMDFRLICSETGNIPEEFCDNQVIDFFIPGISRNQKCTHKKKVFVSADESFSYCTTCLPHDGYKVSYYPDLTQDLISYYEAEHLPYIKIPAHNSNCTRIFTEHAPEITSPVKNKEYLVEKGEEQQLMLSCNADNEAKILYWYINDRFYKSCAAGEKLFFIPSAGKIKISCSDDRGRNTDIEININYL